MQEEIEDYSKIQKNIEAINEVFQEEAIGSYFFTSVIPMLFSKDREERDEATEILADKIKKEFYLYTIRHDELPETWIYSEGIYIPQGKTFIKEKCRKLLGKAYTTTVVNKVIAKIETDTYIDPEEFFKNNIADEIVCKNGIIELRTGKLKPYDPERIHFTKIPVTYDPAQTCPKINKFFDDILETPEDKQAIFELFGYCLWKDSFLEQAVMMLGTGRNGKSKTLELLKRLLGEENTKGIALQKLEEDNFSECELFGKLANLCGDISNQPLNHTGKFKGLTGRDTLSASRKFKTKIEFVNYAKLIFSTNNLPKTADTTDAFWERWVYFRFPYSFFDQDEIDFRRNKGEDMSRVKLKDPDIVIKISTPNEMSGLLNEAIKGLQRALADKKFTTSKTAEQIMRFWIQQSDSFMAFCIDCLEESSDGFIPKDELRKAYQKYCKLNKAKIESSDKWIKDTLATRFGASEDYRTVDIKNEDGTVAYDAYGKSIKDRKYIWTGLKMKNS